jgi:hypothetical protein
LWLNSIEEGWQVDSSKDFYRVKEMSVCTSAMFMAWILLDWEKVKDKNRRRCFQGYEGVGDIVCPTGKSSWIIVFHLICHRKLEIYDFVHVIFYADDMKLFLPVKAYQDFLKILLNLNKHILEDTLLTKFV